MDSVLVYITRETNKSEHTIHQRMNYKDFESLKLEITHLLVGISRVIYEALKFNDEVFMRQLGILVSVISLLLSACQNIADLERQKNLIEQTNRAYSVTEKQATEAQPKKYEFCGNDQYPCPVITKTQLDCGFYSERTPILFLSRTVILRLRERGFYGIRTLNQQAKLLLSFLQFAMLFVFTHRVAF